MNVGSGMWSKKLSQQIGATFPSWENQDSFGGTSIQGYKGWQVHAIPENNFWVINEKCDGSDGRAAASYPADSGLNPAVSGSYEMFFF